MDGTEREFDFTGFFPFERDAVFGDNTARGINDRVQPNPVNNTFGKRGYG